MHRPGICKHFRGTNSLRCAAGLVYTAVIKESARLGHSDKLPCIQDLGPGDRGLHTPGFCAKYEDSSGEDLSLMLAFQPPKEEELAAIKAIEAAVRQRAGGVEYDGYHKCPQCKGKVFVVFEPKNKFLGRCETPGCLKWRNGGIKGRL